MTASLKELKPCSSKIPKYRGVSNKSGVWLEHHVFFSGSNSTRVVGEIIISNMAHIRWREWQVLCAQSTIIQGDVYENSERWEWFERTSRIQPSGERSARWSNMDEQANADFMINMYIVHFSTWPSFSSLTTCELPHRKQSIQTHTIENWMF